MSIRTHVITIAVISVVGLLSGCMSNPLYKDISDGDNSDDKSILRGEVNFRVNPHYSGMGIPCIAIMPFDVDASSKDAIKFHKPIAASSDNGMDLPGSEPSTNVDSGALDPNDVVYPEELTAADKANMLRRLFYGYMAPSRVKLVDLDQIDTSLKEIDSENDLEAVGKAVKCNWVLKGRITAFSMHFVGVFANLSVGANLELVRASDGKLLWEGNHVARSQAGALPLSPLDLAMGTFKATSILNADELESVASDLARRLVRTMPLEPNNVLVRTARINHFYRVAARSLNLRSGPGTDYRVEKVLTKSERVTLLDGESHKSWYHVMALDGTQGYVSRRYLKPLAFGTVLVGQDDTR